MIAISIPEERWVFGSRGSAHSRGLAGWVRSTPMIVRGWKRILADLERMEEILERAARTESSGIWRSTFDYAILRGAER